MQIARPRAERFEQVYDYFNWLDEQLDLLDNDYDADAETFISHLRTRTNAIDHQIRHVLLVCDALVNQLCDRDFPIGATNWLNSLDIKQHA